MTTETHVAEPSTYRVFDGHRYLNVHGRELSYADTQQGTSVRWTEMTLYRTNSGKYVLEKVGRSDVYHSVACTQDSKGMEFADLSVARQELSDESGEREFAPCNRCQPRSNEAPVFAERDIYSASVFETAEAMIESLFKPGSPNAKFLTRIGRELLGKASEHDEVIAQLMHTPIDVD